jgi:hypothetical protein
MNSARIVQFFHPGGEYDRSLSLAAWTTEEQPHRRKFMQVTGRAIAVDGMNEGELTVWGEWEPQAECIQTLASTNAGFPQRLWRPYWSLSTAPANRLNTDPMVFGGFRYTVCQQHSRYRGQWRPTSLQQLTAGSVIFFGSHLSGEFILDTVFVVKAARRHDPLTYRELEVPDPYFAVTLATLYQGLPESGCCKTHGPGDQYTLYDGATVDEPINGMFSYVPCKPLVKQNLGFARPTIRHPLLSSTQAQGYGIPFEGNLEGIETIWRDVRNQVLRQDLNLATWIDFPPEGLA